MSSGYAIYSLDWGKFQGFVSKPTDKQLAVLAKRLGEEWDAYDDEIDEDDPVQDGSDGAAELHGPIIERLALSDWYGDLSDAGKEIWSQADWGFCCHERLSSIGFRAHGIINDYDLVMPVLEKLAKKKRMLFVQVNC